MAERLPQNQVLIMYDGILSDKLNWQQDKLDIFSQKADLQTLIHIKRGERQERAQISQLGDKLAFRQMGSPTELFTHTRQQAEATVTINPLRRQAEIFIHDQVLQEHVRQENDGIWSETKFSKKVNTLVGDNLRSILRWEKSSQIREGAKEIGIDTVLLAVELGFPIVAIIKTVDITMDMISATMSFNEQRALLDVMKMVVMICLYKMGTNSIGRLRARRENDKNISPSVNYMQAHLPTKHAADWLSADWYLYRKGRELVTLDKQ